MMPTLARQRRLSARRAECVLSERTDPGVENQVRPSRFFRPLTRFLAS